MIIHLLITVICHVVAWWSYVWRHLLGLLGVTSYVRLLNCCMGHHLNSSLLKKSYQSFSGYEHILIIKLWNIYLFLIKNIYKLMRHSFVVSTSFIFPSEVTDGWEGFLNMQQWTPNIQILFNSIGRWKLFNLGFFMVKKCFKTYFLKYLDIIIKT